MIAHLVTPGPSSIAVTRQWDQFFCIWLSILQYLFSRLCTYLFVNCVCGYLRMIAHLETPGPSSIGVTRQRNQFFCICSSILQYLFVNLRLWMCVNYGSPWDSQTNRSHPATDQEILFVGNS